MMETEALAIPSSEGCVSDENVVEHGRVIVVNKIGKSLFTYPQDLSLHPTLFPNTIYVADGSLGACCPIVGETIIGR